MLLDDENQNYWLWESAKSISSANYVW